jgi:nicotinamidase-related amidase
VATKKNLFKTMKEILDPGHTCLVVWDAINPLIDRIFNKDQFLENLSSLLKEARKYGVPVVYTRIAPLPFNFESPWRMHFMMRRYHVEDPTQLPIFSRPGGEEAEIHSSISPIPGDMVIHKHTTSIFIGTNFENMMRSAGIQTILFTGIATDIGVDTSARDAGNRGFYSVVVSDCVSSTNKEMHELSLKVLGNSVCPVMPSAEIIEQWKQINSEARLMPVL